MRAIAMMMITTLVGCATSYQSARVLAPGKTQVTVAATRIEPSEGSGHLNVGDLQVRHGTGSNIDIGVRLVRTPGGLQNISGAGADLKIAVTESAAKTAVSFALPIGVVWEEQGTDFQNGALTIGPTMFVGVELAPLVELVLSPKLIWLLPDGGTDNNELEFGASLGVRFFDSQRSWALQPEIGILRFSDGNDSTLVYSFGVGVAVGD